jgi:hypothetical protein
MVEVLSLTGKVFDLNRFRAHRLDRWATIPKFRRKCPLFMVLFFCRRVGSKSKV